jgi:hypothetical protein
MKEYTIETDKNSYLTFDPTSLRDVIVNRLNQGQIFTDQNYQGSNLAALIDIISYSFSSLLFYLNKTSSESMFSEAQIYENMNRIVKILNYKPVGRLSQSVAMGITVSDNLSKGNYVIPRFSYLSVGDSLYSVNQDLTFTKSSLTNEIIPETTNRYLLYQGIFEEYPTYTAIGTENEVIYLALPETTQIDHFNIFVYVKPQNGIKWEKWDVTQELFLAKSGDKVYETRFNENKRYEITFGNNINGKKLNAQDQVAIYYLRIDPNTEPLGANSINSAPLVVYNSLRYSEILKDTIDSYGTYLNFNTINSVRLTNTFPSTTYTPEENVENIKRNAPKNFRAQHRLVTLSDYESYLRINFSNILADTKILDNQTYLNKHLRYLYSIGLNDPQIQNQVLFNQIKFANSCNFNNLYIYGIPKPEEQIYLSPSQKEIIIDRLQNIKTLNSQIVMMDPVFINLAFYVQAPNQEAKITDIAQNKLLIYKTPNTKRPDSAILSEVADTIRNTFNKNNLKLGQSVNLYQLSTDILTIEGVDYIQTYREDYQVKINGISMLFWNPLYPDQDISVYTQNVQLEDFQYPVFFDLTNLEDYLQVTETIASVKAAEF